ncbi:ABC transporter permease [Aestuariivirga sp.]|uniref:ABC transporter permease n=1 Tax=Aestuariivirga sp. TaxID=2650926 RepID=UPI0039E3E8F5
MSELALARPSFRAEPPVLRWLVALAVAAAVILYLARGALPGLSAYPDWAIIPFKDWLGAAMTWIKVNFTWATRSITAIVAVPLNFAFGLLAKGFKIGTGPEAWLLPKLSWAGVVCAMALAGWVYGGMRLALLCGLGFLALALFNLWESAMLTLALIIICVPMCVAAGLLVGIWGYRQPAVNRFFISPALDLMQTMPTFAYLIPMLLLFGSSPVSALLATSLFATPPMVRATILGLNKVPQEIIDFADMTGCTRAQKLWRVQIPSAKPSLMIGINQVIMLALNMVIVASMIGAGGLGYDVLLALRALKVGQAMEAGLAIVVIAIVLDRLSQAIARKRPEPPVRGGFAARHANLLLALAILAVTTLAGLAVPALDQLPKAATLTTAPYWKAAVDWITVNFFDAIEAGRVFVLLYFLNPLRALFEGLPWLGVLLIIAALGWRLGGIGLAATVGVLTFFAAATGLWVPAMQTLYLCGASALIACLLGIPIGLWASRSDRVAAAVKPVIDTLQTIPSFCFIIPVVMLFRVGDVTAMIATVAFAIVPAIRYTNHGIREVPVQLIEAGRVSGCTRWQLFHHVQLPLALPEIMLGINQTILLALSMIIICAMIGTRDLGQEVFKALSKADSGRGLVAGLVIAFIGIIADRLITAWVTRMRARQGAAA